MSHSDFCGGGGALKSLSCLVFALAQEGSREIIKPS